MPASVTDEYRSVQDIPPIRIYGVPGATVSGPTHCSTRGRIITANGINPRYLDQLYRADRVSDPVARDVSVRRLAGPLYVVTNFWCKLYGHFLLESIGRILQCAFLYKLGYDFPIAVSGEFPRFVKDIIAAIIPSATLYEFDPVAEIIAPDLLVMPTMGHWDYDFHPFILKLLDAAEYLPWQDDPALPKKLYVSREHVISATRQGGRLLNEPELARAVTDIGYTTIHPQELVWTEQVRAFRAATHIIGEQGSGLHNAIFSRDLESLVSINRYNPVQQRIASARGHAIGFVTDDTGRLFEEFSIWDYTIDVPDLAANLRVAEHLPPVARPVQPDPKQLLNPARWNPALLVELNSEIKGMAELEVNFSMSGPVVSGPNLYVGTSDAGDRVCGITFRGSAGAPDPPAIEYQVLRAEAGWTDWVSPGAYAGPGEDGVPIYGFRCRPLPSSTNGTLAVVGCVCAGRFEHQPRVVVVSDCAGCVGDFATALTAIHVALLDNTRPYAWLWRPAYPYLDPEFYVSHNPDVARSGADPYDHYMSSGWREGRNPSARFDTNFYLESNPDVRAAGMNPLLHFLEFGQSERRPTRRAAATA